MSPSYTWPAGSKAGVRQLRSRLGGAILPSEIMDIIDFFNVSKCFRFPHWTSIHRHQANECCQWISQLLAYLLRHWCALMYPALPTHISKHPLWATAASSPNATILHHCTGVVHQQSRDTRLFHHLHALFAGQHIVWVEARAASRVVRATAV